MNDKVLALLGFASKAGKLSYGMDSVRTTLSQKKSKLVLIANDVSQKSMKEVNFHCEKYSVKAIILSNFDMQTVSQAVGKKCGIVSVNDSSFSNGLISALSAISREEN